MGMMSHLLVADASEADAIVAAEEPTQAWDGFSYQGLDRVNLATFWAIVEAGLAEDRFEERLDAIRTISASDRGPWVDILPAKMLHTLATIAAMDEAEQGTVAERWGQTDELEGWDAADVLDLVRSIGDTAETALLRTKTLILWTGY